MSKMVAGSALCFHDRDVICQSGDELLGGWTENKVAVALLQLCCAKYQKHLV